MKQYLILGAAVLALALPASARDITVGFQTVVEPSKVPQADGAYEAAVGAPIDWRKFDSGADVIAAIASGALDIGYLGSSPLAAAASQELPIETFYIVGLIGASEALVARDGTGVSSVRDLVGKTVATLWAPYFPKYVLLEPGDAARGFVAVMLICALASTLAIRTALRVDPATAIGG